MKDVIEEKDLASCSEEEKDLFMYNMYAIETLLSILLEPKYFEVKVYILHMNFGLSFKIYWKEINLQKSLE